MSIVVELETLNMILNDPSRCSERRVAPLQQRKRVRSQQPPFPFGRHTNSDLRVRELGCKDSMLIAIALH